MPRSHRSRPRSHRSSKVVIDRHVPVTFTIDSPMGPVEVTYGSRYIRDTAGSDQFFARYRSVDIAENRVEGLRSYIDRIEADFQEKKRLAAARKKIQADPIAAVYRNTLEPISVRGTDQRNGTILVTLADGTKTSLSPDDVLRPLEDHERADLLALQRAIERAHQAVPSTIRAEEAVADAPDIDLEVHYDVATGERVTTYDGKEYRGKDARDLEAQVWRDLLAARGYTLVEGLDGKVAPLAEADWFRGYRDVFKTQAEVDALDAAEQAWNEAKQALRDALAEYVMDLSFLKEHEAEEA